MSSDPRPRERGTVPLELALGAGLLVLPVALLVLTLPTWAERQSMARLAAREAARTAVLADTFAQGVAAGEGVARQVAANHGIEPGDLTVAFTGSLTRDGTVTASVRVRIPAATVPGIAHAGTITWSTTHTERVDRYRSFP